MDKRQIILQLAYKLNDSEGKWTENIIDNIIFLVADKMGDENFASLITPHHIRSGAKTDDFFEKFKREEHQKDVNKTLETIKNIKL